MTAAAAPPKPTPVWHCRRTVIQSATGEPYLVRYSISCPLGSVKLHHILRSDEDRDCHDHPWSFCSVILRGGYFEHTPRRDEYSYPGTRQTDVRWYGPGSILWRPAPSVHRLELPEGRPAWTLVLTGPRVREWGFHTVCGFIPWIWYEQAKQDGC